MLAIRSASSFFKILLLLSVCLRQGFTQFLQNEQLYSQNISENASPRFLSTALPFNNIINSTGSLIGESLVALNSGDFVITGFSDFNNKKKLLLMKADSQGHVQSAKEINRAEDTQASSMVQTSTQDLVIAGYTTIGTDQQIVVLRVSNDNSINWMKLFQDSGKNLALDVELLTNTGGTEEILVTCTSQPTGQEQQVGMIKLDLNGNVLFQKRYALGARTSGVTSRRSSLNSDQFFIMGNGAPQGSSQAYFGKFNNAGDQIYGYYYGRAGEDRAQEVIELQNQQLILAGEKIASSSHSIEIMKFDRSSNSIVWHKEMHNLLQSKVKAMEMVDSSSIILGGYYSLDNLNNKDFTCKFDTSGNFAWNLQFFYGGYEEVKDLMTSSTNVTVLVTQNTSIALASIPVSGVAQDLVIDATQVGWNDVTGTTTFQVASLVINNWSSLSSSSLSHSFINMTYQEYHQTEGFNTPDSSTGTGNGTGTGSGSGSGSGSSDSSDIWLAVGLSIASIILLVIVVLVCIKFRKSVTKSKELSAHDQRYKSRSETPMITEKERLAVTTDEIVIDVTAPRSSQHLIIPPRFICPISHEIMSDPVNNKHKEAFERVCLEFRMQQEKAKIPPLLITNNKLKREIETWILEQPVELIRKRKALREKIHNWISKRGRENLERDPVLREIVEKFDAALEAK